MSISLDTKGRNTIPIIKSDNIITLHGKNGVGKSMASTLMEIASGNYVFENIDQFSKLKKIFEGCNINFKISIAEQYQVKMLPYLWKFDKGLNRVDPLTIGSFFLNDKEVSFEDFRKNIFVRTIRGNESLQQQILFFKDVFLGKIDFQIQNLERKLEFLTKYQNWLNKTATEEQIKNYQSIQTTYNDKLNEHANLKNTLRNRKNKIETCKQQKELLTKLLFLLENNPAKIESNIKSYHEKITHNKEQIGLKYTKLAEIKAKIEEINTKYDKKTHQFISKVKNLQKKMAGLKKVISDKFEVNIDESEVKTNDILGEIKNNETTIQELKKSIEQLNRENTRIIQINKYITNLRDTLGKASTHSFSNEPLITGRIEDDCEISLTFHQMYTMFKDLNIQFSQNEKLEQYKSKVKEKNKKIGHCKSLLEKLNEYHSLNQEIGVIQKKIRGSHANLDEYLDLEKQMKHLEENQASFLKQIEQLEQEKTSFKLQLRESQEVFNLISTSHSKISLLSQLKEKNLRLVEPTIDKCEKQLVSIEKEIKDNSKKLILDEDHQNTIKADIGKIRTKITEIQGSIQKAAKEFGKMDVGEYIDEILLHRTIFNEYLENSKKIFSRLKVLREDIHKIVNGGKPKNIKNVQIVNDHFNTIFKQIYGRKEFFEYVFKDYRQIKSFDISKKTIVFETHAGLEEKRDLEEFSSGEKTYAYCRAIISMTANIAKHNIVILDESYALLDHEHSQNLYQFQFEMIKAKKITKFINILPLKEDLSSSVSSYQQLFQQEEKNGNSTRANQIQEQLVLVKSFMKEVSDYGYYQELLFPNNKTLQNFLNLSIISNDSQKNNTKTGTEQNLACSFILDGSNISRNNQNSKFAKISDVLKCKKALLELGVPEENVIIMFGAGIRHYIAEIEKHTFNQLLKEPNVNQAPKGRDDDYFIIQYALKNNSFIVTNDYFNEYQKRYPEYVRFLQAHSVRYSVILNDFIFEEGFEKKLDEIVK